MWQVSGRTPLGERLRLPNRGRAVIGGRDWMCVEAGKPRSRLVVGLFEPSSKPAVHEGAVFSDLLWGFRSRQRPLLKRHEVKCLNGTKNLPTAKHKKSVSTRG
jgi:hypothetical protein